MVFKQYSLQVAIRVLAIFLGSLLFAWVIQLEGYWVVKANIALLLLGLVYLLYRFLNKWKRDFEVFADSVRHNDFTITFQKYPHETKFTELYALLNEVGAYARTVKSDLIQQNQHFRYTVDNLQIGLITYDESGAILLHNSHALQIIGASGLSNLKDIAGINPELHDAIKALQINHARLVVIKKAETMKLSARLSEFKIEEKSIFLLSIMNIRSELEENELQSWQDLINVLTHEIMNSVTPINSLIGSMKKYLDRAKTEPDQIEKAKSSLEIIDRRSRSLMDFVQRYRAISNVPLPRLERVELKALAHQVTELMDADLAGIEVVLAGEELSVLADPSQIEQVVINIIRNSLQSMVSASEKKILIETVSQGQRCMLRITDSGTGMTSEIMSKIFIPFFTTRKDGSGIGLTLSRQIMQRHNGSIQVSSAEMRGSVFTLVFPRVSDRNDPAHTFPEEPVATQGPVSL